MTERIIAQISRLIVRLLPGAWRPMRGVWWWLASHTDDPSQRQRYFDLVLEIDSRRGPAYEALVELWRSAPDNNKGNIARRLREALEEQEASARK